MRDSLPTKEEMDRLKELREKRSVIDQEIKRILGIDGERDRPWMNCLRCGYTWQARGTNKIPGRCGKCLSQYWNKEYTVTSEKMPRARFWKDRRPRHHYKKPSPAVLSPPPSMDDVPDVGSVLNRVVDRWAEEEAPRPPAETELARARVEEPATEEAPSEEVTE
jgi:predicted Zn-ribbon and HTH transcriptional regulator